MADYRLKFDGYKLTLLQDGIAINSWDAVSGRPGVHIWCAKPYAALGLIMISDALHDAWLAAGLGPMGYITCIDV